MAKTILIAEDSSSVRKFITLALKMKGYNVIATEDGMEALEKLPKNNIDLLVTDLNMPKIDGMRLLIYKNQNFPEIPCIIMTAHSTKKIKKRLQQEVINYICTKRNSVHTFGTDCR